MLSNNIIEIYIKIVFKGITMKKLHNLIVSYYCNIVNIFIFLSSCKRKYEIFKHHKNIHSFNTKTIKGSYISFDKNFIFIIDTQNTRDYISGRKINTSRIKINSIRTFYPFEKLLLPGMIYPTIIDIRNNNYLITTRHPYVFPDDIYRTFHSEDLFKWFSYMINVL